MICLFHFAEILTDMTRNRIDQPLVLQCHKAEGILFRPQTQTLSTRSFVSCQFNRVAPWTFRWLQQLIQRLQTFPNSLENSSKDRPKEKTWVKICPMLEYGDGHHGPLGCRFLSYPFGLRFLFANSHCELWMLGTRKFPLKILITVERKKKTPSNLKRAKLIMISWVDLLIAATANFLKELLESFVTFYPGVPFVNFSLLLKKLPRFRRSWSETLTKSSPHDGADTIPFWKAEKRCDVDWTILKQDQRSRIGRCQILFVQ